MTGGKIQIRLDDKEGTIIGTCEISNTGGWDSWKLFKAKINKVTFFIMFNFF